MSFVAGPVTIRIPASSANLGPGFDALGLALSLYDEITAECLPAGGLVIEISGEGAATLPRDGSHLVATAMARAFAQLGEAPAGLRIRCHNVIPHGRGLGSSAAAIIGGIVAACALVEDGDARLDAAAMLRIANDLEGHPDNVAAALLGGLTIAWTTDGVGEAVRLDACHDVSVFIPAVPVSTSSARAVLPAHVTHADAAANAGRAALLVAALAAGRAEVLLAATQDRLHQDYRAAQMPDSYALMCGLRADGIPAIISGAGPTVLAFAAGAELAARTPAGWTHHELCIDAAGATRIA